MIRRYLLLFSLILVSPYFVISADKKKEEKPKVVKLSALKKAARNALKANPPVSGPEIQANVNAQNGLLAALPRTDITEKHKADILYTCALIDENLNGVENRKAYLKQPYDTAAFFNHLLNMYNRLAKCDSIDSVPDASGRIKLKFRSRTRSLRSKHRQNIYNASKFFLNKKNYDLAYNFIDAYSETNKNTKDTLLQRMSYWAALCGYNSQKPMHTLKYIDRAINVADSAHKPILQEYKCNSYYLLKDEEYWVRELYVGVRKYPAHDYFFVNINDILLGQHRLEEGIALCDSMLRVVGDKPIYWYAKSRMELSDNNYEKCIEFSDSTIRRKDDFLDAYYNKGIAYMNLALIAQDAACTDLTDPKCLNDLKEIQMLYSGAKPCMEKVRELAPNDTARWAPALYRIYMNLNMGKEFDEIDKLLHDANMQTEGN